MSGFVSAPMCVECWNEIHGESTVVQSATHTHRGPNEVCQWCSLRTDDGIYVRAHALNCLVPDCGELQYYKFGFCAKHIKEDITKYVVVDV